MPRLCEKTDASRSGTPLFTLRADNWNERLGIIDAQRVALVAPGAPGLSAPGEAPTLRPVTLQRVLKVGMVKGDGDGNAERLEGQLWDLDPQQFSGDQQIET